MNYSPFLKTLGISLWSCLSLMAQYDPPIGRWNSHLPYQQGIKVAYGGDRVFFATPWSVISIDESDFSYKKLDRVEGLSDTGVETLVYDDFNDQLVIAYTNGNLDFVDRNGVTNLPTILRNNTIIGSKRINHLFSASRDRMILSMDFGIVELDPDELLFGNTIITNMRINGTAQRDGLIYAAGADGLYFADLLANRNIADFSRWDEVQLLAGEELLHILLLDGDIWLATKTEVYALNRSHELVKIYTASVGDQITQLAQAADQVAVGVQRIGLFEGDVFFIDRSGVKAIAGAGCVSINNGLAITPEGRIWYADLGGGFRYANEVNGNCSVLSVTSPYSHTSSEIAVQDGLVAVASGGVSDNYQYLFGRDGIYLRNNGQWFNFNEQTNPVVAAFDLLSPYRVFLDLKNTTLWVGSYWAGLLRYHWVDQKYTVFNKENSTLRGAIGDEARERVTGIVKDEDDNLWVTTFGASRPLHLLSAEGEWTSFDLSGQIFITSIKRDARGYFWMTIAGANPGVAVLDVGDNLRSSADDRLRIINRSNSIITSSRILSHITDRQGIVWVGTSEGPYIFDCGERVFSADCRGVQRIVEQDGIPARLLADQQINVISVDGADRKWFGTTTGVYVQSSSGDEQVFHFTTQNSPLPDNEITAMAFDDISGIMWIGTNKGIVSYNTGSTAPASTHLKDDIYAYPNPVTPDYRGDIAIRGLINNATVKITDVEGNLVRELRALGGQAVWDGLDTRSRTVGSGVYLVFSSGGEPFGAPDSFVTKIMVIR